MTLKFINPFQGSPSPLKLSRLFLPSPLILQEIDGDGSVSKTFKDLEMESLLKRIESAKKGNVSRKRLDSIIKEFQNSAELSPEAREFFNELVEVANKEEAAGGFVPESIGDYATMIRAVNGTAKPKTISQRFLLDVEEKSRKAFVLTSTKKFSEAGKAILDEEFFSPFLWEGMRNQLSQVKTYEQFLLIQVSIMAEVFLALITIREFEYEKKSNNLDTHSFLEIWPLGSEKTKNPFGRLFDWTKLQANVKTITEFFDHPAFVDVEMDHLRLKRWSNGSHQPKKEWLSEISKSLWGDSFHLPFAIRLFVAKYSNFIGHTLQSIMSETTSANSLENRAQASHWPCYPHENTDFGSWGRSRYQFWRDFARDYDLKSK